MSPELVLHVHNAQIVIDLDCYLGASAMLYVKMILSGVSDSNIKHWSLSATLIAHLLTVKCCTLL